MPSAYQHPSLAVMEDHRVRGIVLVCAELPLLIGEPETLSYDEVQRIAGRLLHNEEWQTREIPKAIAKTGVWIEGELLEEEPYIKPWMIESADDHYALDITRARTVTVPGPSAVRAAGITQAAFVTEPA